MKNPPLIEVSLYVLNWQVFIKAKEEILSTERNEIKSSCRLDWVKTYLVFFTAPRSMKFPKDKLEAMKVEVRVSYSLLLDQAK